MYLAEETGSDAGDAVQRKQYAVKKVTPSSGLHSSGLQSCDAELIKSRTMADF